MDFLQRYMSGRIAFIAVASAIFCCLQAVLTVFTVGGWSYLFLLTAAGSAYCATCVCVEFLRGVDRGERHATRRMAVYFVATLAFAAGALGFAVMLGVLQ